MFVVIGQVFPQFAESVLHAGKRGVDGDLLMEGDGFKRKVSLGAEEVHFPLVFGERVDRCPDPLCQFPVPGCASGAWGIVWQKLFEGTGSLGGAHRLLEADIGIPFAGEIDNPVFCDTEEPRNEIPAVIAVESSYGTEPYILEDVIGPMRVVDHAQDETVERSSCKLDDTLQGFRVPVPVLGQ